jgi:hypothetical protein
MDEARKHIRELLLFDVIHRPNLINSEYFQ